MSQLVRIIIFIAEFFLNWVFTTCEGNCNCNLGLTFCPEITFSSELSATFLYRYKVNMILKLIG